MRFGPIVSRFSASPRVVAGWVLARETGRARRFSEVRLETFRRIFGGIPAGSASGLDHLSEIGNRVSGRFRLYFIDRCGVGIRPGIGPSGLKLEGAAAPERGQPEESFRPKADQGQASTFGRKCIRWGVSTNSLRSFMGPIHVLVQFRFNFLPV